MIVNCPLSFLDFAFSAGSIHPPVTKGLGDENAYCDGNAYCDEKSRLLRHQLWLRAMHLSNPFQYFLCFSHYAGQRAAIIAPRRSTFAFASGGLGWASWLWTELFAHEENPGPWYVFGIGPRRPIPFLQHQTSRNVATIVFSRQFPKGQADAKFQHRDYWMQTQKTRGKMRSDVRCVSGDCILS